MSEQITKKQYIYLEGSLLKAISQKIIREFKQRRKVLERQTNAILQNLSKLRKCSDFEEFKPQIGEYLTQIQELQSKHKTMVQKEQELFQMLQKRIKLLRQFETQDSIKQAYRVKLLDRLIVDFIARQGFFNSAFFYASSTKTLDYIDQDLYLQVKDLADKIKERQFDKPLKWCIENRSKLTRMENFIQVDIRIQQFIQLIRSNEFMRAHNYCKKYLKPLIPINKSFYPKLSKVVTLLGISETQRPYFNQFDHFFSQQRLEDLSQNLVETIFLLHSMSYQASLTNYLQLGLTSLKTSLCKCSTQNNQQIDKIGDESSPSKNMINIGAQQRVRCPVCEEYYREIAMNLPCMTRSGTRVLCKATGVIMDDKNPPILLPNGNVYSSSIVKEYTNSSKGKIQDPYQAMNGVNQKNIETFKVADQKKIFFF